MLDLTAEYIAHAAQASRKLLDMDAEASRLEQEGSPDAETARRLVEIMRASRIGWNAATESWYAASGPLTMTYSDPAPR